ncbi:type IV pilin, partial [Halorubrum sp. JWXQ-INN 858]|uniref:type IV pilin n=1 Tax=Halorubrum sp. JWXQ-INN 858 TaxID=2690782 RepID=UPI001356D6B1
TVILAAVIGTFVLGLGDSIGENAPSASYDWDQFDGSDETPVAEVTHVSGQNLDPDRLSARVTYADGSDADTVNDLSAWDADSISSGASISFGGATSGADEASLNDLNEDDEIRIIWTASGGGSSSTLTSYTIA